MLAAGVGTPRGVLMPRQLPQKNRLNMLQPQDASYPGLQKYVQTAFWATGSFRRCWAIIQHTCGVRVNAGKLEQAHPPARRTSSMSCVDIFMPSATFMRWLLANISTSYNLDARLLLSSSWDANTLRYSKQLESQPGPA